jgi:hypothetical protein
MVFRFMILISKAGILAIHSVGVEKRERSHAVADRITRSASVA